MPIGAILLSKIQLSGTAKEYFRLTLPKQ